MGFAGDGRTEGFRKQGGPMGEIAKEKPVSNLFAIKAQSFQNADRESANPAARRDNVAAHPVLAPVAWVACLGLGAAFWAYLVIWMLS